MAEDQVNPGADAGPLDARLLRALQAAPHVNIPAGFAARVAGQLPPRPAPVLTPLRYGPLAAMACMLGLLGLLLANAHCAGATSPYWQALESILSLQFALLAVWIVARNAGYTLPSLF